jgi:isoleucyl-tRNA synthetase
MIPFMTEEIYQNLVAGLDENAPRSIHFCDYPAVHEEWIDAELEESMKDVLGIVVQGRACRNTANMKNRQPLSRLYVKAPFTLTSFFTDIIRDELNVKEVVFTDDVSSFTSYSFKPQLRTVGPKYGKQLGGIRKYLAELDGNSAMDTLRSEGALRLEVNGVAVELLEEDLLIETARKEGYVSQEDGGFTTVLDTNLTPELVEEGYVYELISKIQTMRKESGFEVMDRIRVSLNGNDKLSAVAAKNEAAIAGKVLADRIEKDTELANQKKWDINGEKVTIGVQKI